MRRFLLPALLVPMILAGIGYAGAVRAPVVRRATVSLPGWPAGAKPVTIALLSDIHIGNLATGRARFARVAESVRALRPDLILLAGDFIAGHSPTDADAAPELVEGLRRLHAPLGVVAVPGNHDHWTNIAKVRAALQAGGVTLLANQAVRRGPLAIGGLDDLVTRHDDLPATVAALRALGGARLMLSHSPDVSPKLPADISLLLAGHTHCGQVVLPILGAPVHVSRYGLRYLCGVVREGARTTIVTGGIGTSVLPFRYGAPPDIWLVRGGP
ncbi:metallophosphoesterase [Sphingomonas sp.]|uniref:metallophosphoesterase n=1 Tax=Sphingomonas sp. TaxID=28214 RepID=UPI0035BC00D3